ncbi:MAG: hypothetical protein WCD76_03670 [Pyrinomonadaceae bacterium]
MSVDAKAITERWDQIRGKEECDLSLTPESVADYLSIPESQLVRARMVESLVQFANYRIDNADNRFASSRPATPGDMATCEGLDTFLIPAVEGALSFSNFLEHYEAKGGDRERFVNAIKKDITGLLDNWENGLFSGEPYANVKKIHANIDPGLKEQFKHINITESAALACRVLIHLLTLKLNRTDEALFQREIGDALDEGRLFKALSEAIGFLVRAFQKGEGETEEEQIVNAQIGTYTGSGWSWTDRPGLPPMLFFTAAAVDAFAELDLYLIRNVLKREWVSEGLKLAVFHRENEEKLQHFQLCVDMARRWVQKAVLPYLIEGDGQYQEKLFLGKNQAAEYLGYKNNPEGYGQYKDDVKRWKEFSGDPQDDPPPPMVFYNNLYALLILLWSWGDRNDDGQSVDDDAKNKINRAISQLVFNYSSVPVVREILNRFEYIFYLPGKDIFKAGSDKEREYLDSAFLPLLTRLLVLFVVYGVGDRNMLEPVIRNLYVELLQSRHRNRIEYSALWSTKDIEVFSTQRAIQALTFYNAYASGKEIVEEKSGGGDIVLRNRTGFPLVLEALFDRQVNLPEASPAPVTAAPVEPARESPTDADAITEEKFIEYCKKIDGWRVGTTIDSEEAGVLQTEARVLGETIIADYRADKVSNSVAARLILNSLADIIATPITSDGVRQSDFALLKKLYGNLTEQRPATGNNGQ